MITLQYLLEVSICLCLFYAFYYWVLRKETFFQLNRVYLLVCPLFSLAIPLINIELEKTSTASAVEVFAPIIEQSAEVQFLFWKQMSAPTPAFSLTLADIVWLVYLIGAGIMGIQLIIGLWRLSKLIQHSKKEQQDGFTLVETEDAIPAASFFSYVFWNYNNLPESKKIILEHELVHVRQKHTWDVLLMEFWVILKWFNPIIYWYRNSLRITHEFIADQFMVNKMGSPYSYASFLATHRDAGHNSPLASNFASMLRNRLQMLANTPSNKWKLGKYFFSFGIAFFLMLLFSFNMVKQLPQEITRPFKSFNRYVEQISNKNLFAPKELNIQVAPIDTIGIEATEAPQKPEQEKDDSPPENYLEWNNQTIEVISFEKMMEVKDGQFVHQMPVHKVSLEDFQQMANNLPEFFQKGEKKKIARAASIVLNKKETVEFCESINWPKEGCLEKLAEQMTADRELLIAFKTGEYNGFLAFIAIESQAPSFSFHELPKDLASRADIYTRRPVINPKMPKPVFRGEHLELEWAGQSILLLNRDENFTTVDFEAFQQMLSQDVIFIGNGETTKYKSIQVFAAVNSKTNESYSFFREMEKVDFEKYNNEENVLHPFMQELLMLKYAEGYDNFVFGIQIDLYSANGNLFSNTYRSFTIAVVNNEEAAERYDRVPQGLEIDPSVNQFQLINRPGEPTVIKIDTTNQKYRWMYDSYKDKPGMLVVHIPDFKTIHRVLTLEDIVLPKSELRHEIRTNKPYYNVDYQPEYFDFKDKLIQMEWRGFEGVTDNTLYELRKFQRAANSELEISLNNQAQKIVQFDLIFVPEENSGIRYTLSSTKLEEIEDVIRAMGPRTSIFIQNILIEDDALGVVHFPLTFAFHLM